MGYICLRTSNPTEVERYHIIGLAGSSMKFSKSLPFLTDLYQSATADRSQTAVCSPGGRGAGGG